jgi:membrane protein DedA with SNARE-associated domain
MHIVRWCIGLVVCFCFAVGCMWGMGLMYGLGHWKWEGQRLNRSRLQARLKTRLLKQYEKWYFQERKR